LWLRRQTVTVLRTGLDEPGGYFLHNLRCFCTSSTLAGLIYILGRQTGKRL